MHLLDHKKHQEKKSISVIFLQNCPSNCVNLHTKEKDYNNLNLLK